MKPPPPPIVSIKYLMPGASRAIANVMLALRVMLLNSTKGAADLAVCLFAAKGEAVMRVVAMMIIATMRMRESLEEV